LLDGVAEAPADQTEEEHARWLLAYLLDFHRREDKAKWWEYYRLRDLAEEDLYEEPQAIAGLSHVKRVGVIANKKSGKPTGSVIDRYQYPVQEMEIRGGDELKLTDGEKFGDVVEVDRTTRTIDLRKGSKQADRHPTAVFEHTYVRTGVLEDSIYQIGEHVAGGKLAPVTRDLLLARTPHLRTVRTATA
jgi:uncharacterized protein